MRSHPGERCAAALGPPHSALLLPPRREAGAGWLCKQQTRVSTKTLFQLPPTTTLYMPCDGMMSIATNLRYYASQIVRY